MYFAKLAKFTTRSVADEEEPLGSFKDWRTAGEIAIEALRKKPRNAGWVAQIATTPDEKARLVDQYAVGNPGVLQIELRKGSRGDYVYLRHTTGRLTLMCGSPI